MTKRKWNDTLWIGIRDFRPKNYLNISLLNNRNYANITKMIFEKTMKYQPQIKRIGISSFFILTILFQIIFNSIQNNIDNVCPGSRSFIVEFGSTDGYETFIVSSSTKTNSNKISSSYNQKINPDIENIYRQNEIIFSSLINEYLVIEEQNSLLRKFFSFSFLLRSPPSNLS